MAVDKTTLRYYYLTVAEMQHYKYMLSHNYERKYLMADGQQYLIFPVMAKQHVWLAWPTVTKGLDGLSEQNDTIFQPSVPLQRRLTPLVNDPSIKVLLFPRYTR